jgi:CheY-like chemotaxis protein
MSRSWLFLPSIVNSIRLTLAQLLSTFVRKSKYEYDTAENGLKALQAFQSAPKPYDIVFMGKKTCRLLLFLYHSNYKADISMPVMDGMVATREIRKLERSRRQKPAVIIALTGLGSATSQQEAFSNGINLFLTKPVRFSDLRKILNDWIPDMKTESRHI